ncbi:MAG: DUF255 domain-containing protein [candidate division Zixibacteria bacterium]|nr:DUF255 domain-containing protein [candidate division Zixibacteria bacterium]
MKNRYLYLAKIYSAVALLALLLTTSIACSKESETKVNQNNHGKSGHQNKLAGESSPYLLQHASNPVDWYPWGEEALAKAKAEDKPIFLSIGYSACHWCHVMDKESYESEGVAGIINEHFIPVKVDRDERPDVDRRYQIFVQATGSGGGWPLTCFLTSGGKLFFGGTYFPPEDRMGRPGFKNLLLNIVKTYREKRNDVEESSDKLFKKIVDFESTRTKPAELQIDIFTKILKDVEDNFDPVYGGLGISPKFPNGSAHDLALLSYNITGNEKYLDIAKIGLENIAAGGIHDHVGGGFHRYSVDQFWHVPHFEKMTSDNAEFLKNYLHLYQVTGNKHYKKIAEGIIDYYLRDMTDPEMGGFFAYQDADISLEETQVDKPFGVEIYTWIPTPDHNPPNLDQISFGVSVLTKLVSQNKKIYVHCKNGHGRATTLVASYLISKGFTVEEAINLVKEKRPSMHLQDTQKDALLKFSFSLSDK